MQKTMKSDVSLRLRRIRNLLLCVSLPALAGAQSVAVPKRIERTAIVNVTIIDVEQGKRIPSQTIVIEGTRIAAVGGPMRTTAGMRVVDGRNLYAIPGLWDMHTHVLDRGDLRSPQRFPLLIANGITGIRNMHSDASLADLRELRRRVSAGAVVGPRIIIASPMLDGPRSMWPGAIAVADTQRARTIVDSLSTAGADLIKVYSYLPRDIYFAIAARARTRGIPFAGHVPFGSVSASEASDAGQKSIEHVEGVIEQCSTAERELQTRWRTIESRGRGGTLDSLRYVETWALMRHAVETYDAEKCGRMLQHFVDGSTWQTPTFSALHVVSRAGDRAYQNDTLLRFDPELRSERNAIAKMLASSASDAKVVERGVARVVREMQRKHVGLLAGSDTPSGGILPGFSLHDELESMVNAGLSSAEALRTATINPARYLGATDSLGTVSAGKLADLVLLNADPLLDIRNVRRIRGVVLNGRYLDRQALDAMLSPKRSSRP